MHLQIIINYKKILNTYFKYSTDIVKHRCMFS